MKRVDRNRFLDGISALLFALILIFSMLLFQTILVLVIPGAWAYVCYGVLTGGVFGFIYYTSRKKEYVLTGERTSEPVGFKVKNIILIVVIAIAAVGLFEAVMQLIWMAGSKFDTLNKVIKDYNNVMRELDGTYTAIILLYTYLFAPIVEELSFRGLILRRFQKAFGDKISVLIQAFLFGLIHFQLVQSTYAFFLGLIFGYVMIKRKSVIELIIVHMVFNLFGAFLMSQIIAALASCVGDVAADVITAMISVAVLTASLILLGLINKTEKNEETVEEKSEEETE